MIDVNKIDLYWNHECIYQVDDNRENTARVIGYPARNGVVFNRIPSAKFSIER